MNLESNSVKFEVLGEPRGKQRPRMCIIKGKTVTYTPKPTKDYEQKIKSSYNAAAKQFFDKDVPLEIDIKAYFSVPKKFAANVHSKKILPLIPPDVDNVAKVICDALNGVAFFDDKQICKLNIEKYYSKIPKITVEIKVLEVN